MLTRKDYGVALAAWLTKGDQEGRDDYEVNRVIFRALDYIDDEISDSGREVVRRRLGALKQVLADAAGGAR